MKENGYELLAEEYEGIHSFLAEYMKKVLRGDILVGEEMRRAMLKTLNKFENPNYRFDLKDAEKRIRFIETKLQHVEDPFAGKPFLLELEQKAFIEEIFGFYRYSEDYGAWLRLAQRVLLLIARKNGKTPLAASIVLSDWFCGAEGRRVMCASNDYKQAGLVYDWINDMRERNPVLEKCTRKNNEGIFFGNRNQRRKTGKFSRSNKGNIRKMTEKGIGGKEGRNLAVIVLDESHELKDDVFYMQLRQSQSTQKEPLFLEITTEGCVSDGHLDEELKDARQVLSGEKEADEWVIWLYTQDSESEVWDDERAWVKSNPFLGRIKSKEFLRNMVEQAKGSSAARVMVLQKDFNIKQNAAAAWLPLNVIEVAGKFTLNDFRNCYYIGGADLSRTTDLTAVTLLFLKPKDSNVYLYTMYFVPEAKADEDIKNAPTNQEKKDYSEWARDGYVKIIPGSEIDSTMVADWLYALYEEYNIIPWQFGYDGWQSHDFVVSMNKHFGNVKKKNDLMQRINQSYSVLDSAMRRLESDLRAKRAIYGENPVCKWNLRNTGLKMDDHERMMPAKLKGFIGNKIDGTVSKLIAYATLGQCKSSYIAAQNANFGIYPEILGI